MVSFSILYCISHPLNSQDDSYYTVLINEKRRNNAKLNTYWDRGLEKLKPGAE